MNYSNIINLILRYRILSFLVSKWNTKSFLSWVNIMNLFIFLSNLDKKHVHIIVNYANIRFLNMNPLSYHKINKLTFFDLVIFIIKIFSRASTHTIVYQTDIILFHGSYLYFFATTFF